MKQSEKKLTERLRSGTEPAEQSERDALWAAIEGGLPTTGPAVVASTPRAYWQWFALGMLLLVLGGALLTIPPREPNPAPLTESGSGSSHELAEGRSRTSEVASTRETNIPPAAPTTSPGADGKSLFSTHETNTSPAAPVEMNSAHETLPISRESNSGPLAQPGSGSSHEWEAIQPLPTALPPFVNTAPAAPPAIPSPVAPPTKFRKESPRRLSVGTSVGTNVLLTRYRGSDAESVLAQRLTEVTGRALGQQAGVSVSYRFTRDWRLTGGLEYTRAHTTFDYNARFDTTTVHPNFPTGAEIAATAERVLRYNNHFQAISLPLTLEYSRPLGRAELSLGAGVGLNFIDYRRGATLDGAGRPGYFERQFTRQLSYHLRPAISWPAGRLRYFLRGEARWQELSAGLPDGVSGAGLLLGANVGVRFRL